MHLSRVRGSGDGCYGVGTDFQDDRFVPFDGQGIVRRSVGLGFRIQIYLIPDTAVRALDGYGEIADAKALFESSNRPFELRQLLDLRIADLRELRQSSGDRSGGSSSLLYRGKLP
jgi:hypothetical protein